MCAASRARRLQLAALIAVPLLLLFLQHQYLGGMEDFALRRRRRGGHDDDAAASTTSAARARGLFRSASARRGAGPRDTHGDGAAAMPQWPPPPSPSSPLSPVAPTSAAAAAPPLEFVDGELVGAASGARLCVVMPVRSNSLPKAVRNVRSWAAARGSPCTEQTAAAAATADLCIIHSQSFASSRDVDQANELYRALLVRRHGISGAGDGRRGHRPRDCFGAVRFLAARIPLARDVYTIYPTHNFSGPNSHFLETFAALRRLSDDGTARYSHFQLMEHDTYPFQPGWIEALHALVSSRRRREWVQGSRSLCLRRTETEHINGNALYSLDKGFVARPEPRTRLRLWPDLPPRRVEPPCSLSRARPAPRW